MDLVSQNKLEYFIVEKALELVNGDAAYISVEEDHLFICIVDGAGHGPEAHIIAQVCLDFIIKNNALTLSAIMSNLHEELRGTRGAVAIIGRLHYESREFCYVGTGNIFLRVFGAHSKREVTQEGVIGYHIRTPKEKSIHLNTGDILVLHTDGLSSRFNESDYPDILWDDAEKIANCLVDKFEKNNDDSTCTVIRLK
jgi:negative regulator of sigma-B (phosphoserine phosphatase)